MHDHTVCMWDAEVPCAMDYILYPGHVLQWISSIPPLPCPQTTHTLQTTSRQLIATTYILPSSHSNKTVTQGYMYLSTVLIVHRNVCEYFMNLHRVFLKFMKYSRWSYTNNIPEQCSENLMISWRFTKSLWSFRNFSVYNTVAGLLCSHDQQVYRWDGNATTAS